VGKPPRAFGGVFKAALEVVVELIEQEGTQGVSNCQVLFSTFIELESFSRLGAGNTELSHFGDQ
jgi:hypothetical protein